MTNIKHFKAVEDHHFIEYDGTIGDYIVEQFYGTGKSYSVYSGIPSVETDITFDIDALLDSGGDYVVLETPSAGLDVAAWVAIVSAIISVVAIALMPKPDIPKNLNRQQESPNNSLGGRSNRARPLQRIPDIRGTVRSVPDVIMQPYNRYYGGINKVEIGLYCVGRGEYTLTDVRDGDTPFESDGELSIDGASYEIYGPYKSKNNSLPDKIVGETIEEKIVSPFRCNAVDGVEMILAEETGSTPLTNANVGSYGTWPAFETYTEYKGCLVISMPDRLADYPPDYYVGNYIEVTAGDILMYSGVPVVESQYFNFSGKHKIVAYYEEKDNLLNVWSVTLITDFFIDDTKVWYAFGDAVGAGTTWDFSMVTSFSTPYKSWYYMTGAEYNRGFINIVAMNGLYRDNGEKKFKVNIDYQIEIELLDENGADTGLVLTQEASLLGDNSVKRGISIDFELPYPSRFKLRVWRTTGRIGGSGQVVDTTQLEDLYGLVDMTKPHFGDVTTIMTRTLSTPFATSMKERKLNCLATERLNVYQGGGVFAAEKTDNGSAVQSYIRDFIDPVMGKRPLSELDADGLLEMEAEIDAYFGEPNHHQFNFTLDSTDITFQEYTQILFNAINSIAYRDGSIVRAKFEKADPTPQMLFTHRSKLPDSETYSRNMNYFALNDGVEFIWVNPLTDTQEVIYIPSDKSATNPRRIEMAGFRDEIQATKRAWREYYKILHEKVTVEVEVTAEGRYVRPGDVISIVKGSRVYTTDGEVLEVSLDGYTLTLSQDVTFVDGDTHSIILKKKNGSTQSIICTPGTLPNQVVLAQLPDEAIRTGIDDQRRTEFSFGNEARHLGQLFIARSIDFGNRDSVIIRGVNYTDEYYAADTESTASFDEGFSLGFDS